MKLIPAALLLAFALAGQTRIYAVTILNAILTNGQETSPINPTTSGGAARPVSFGTATFVLNDAMTAMTFTATIFNIDVTGAQTADGNDNLIAAYLHGGAGFGVNAPVIWGFFGTPFNDNNPNDSVFTPFSTGVGGTFSGKWDLPEGSGTTLSGQISNILAGLTYINFHTTQFGGGEIRGQILPPAVPDTSSTALLMGLGFVGILGGGWRKSRVARTAGR